MTNELRVVFDTNVIVSATMFPRSIPNRTMRTANSMGRLLASEETIEELRAVLTRRKFDRYLSAADRTRALDEFLATVEMVAVDESIHDCRDPKDNKFLELAVSGGATHLVTGDDDLLVLHPFRGVAIVTPQAFLDEFSPPAPAQLEP